MMKTLKTTLLITFSLFLLVGCNNDDDSVEETPITNKLYKKSESYTGGILTSDKTVNYTSENKILSITTNHFGFSKLTITVDNESVTRLTEVLELDNSNIDHYNYFDVTRENNKIILVADDTRLEFTHSNGYVDSAKQIDVATSTVILEEIYTRDSNQNLISKSNNDGAIHYYTNFDSDKKIAPFNSVIHSYFFDYYRIFNLKITKNNPLTTSPGQMNSPTTFNKYLKYDNLGYVIKTSYEEDFTYQYTDHQYIEQ